MIDYRRVMMELTLLPNGTGKDVCMALAGASFDAEQVLGYSSVLGKDDYVEVWRKSCEAPDMLSKIQAVAEGITDVISRAETLTEETRTELRQKTNEAYIDGDYEDMMGVLTKKAENLVVVQALAGAMFDAMEKLNLRREDGAYSKEEYVRIFTDITGKTLEEQKDLVMKKVMESVAMQKAQQTSQAVH